jgi:hypothetical protein
VVAVLRVAEALGYVEAEQITVALGYADRVLAMLYRLTNPRASG